jgi:transposase, IS5 family
MISSRRLQTSFADGFIAEETTDLWEPWMRRVDPLIDDDQLLASVQAELGKRFKKSKTRGRPATTAEVALRMLLLKHIRDWSCAVLVREVRANLVYREFTRIGGGKVPDDKTIGRIARQIGPQVIGDLHQRIVDIAQENKAVTGKKMRLDTTVVETNIHYPTDSSLLGDGVRVLTRVMKKVTEVAGDVGTKLRDRTRSVKLGILQIARASRNKSEKGRQKLKDAYGKLLENAGRVVGQAKKFVAEIEGKVKKGARGTGAALARARKQLEEMIPRVEQVVRQARQRVMHGQTRAEGKIVSMFEPQTEVIRKGKASKPTEFGKMLLVQEAENQIVVNFEVFDQRPSDASLLVPALESHIGQFGQAPRVLASDAGFFSAANEAAAEELGVKQVAIPSRSTQSEKRKSRQKLRWFKKAQKWRTGCEGRISVLKRRHGLNRCRYKGQDGMKRWVALGVIADNLINLGTFLEAKAGKESKAGT